MANNASNRAVRNLKSAGYSAAKVTGDITSKTAVGLFKWAATDHSGMSDAIKRMPKMGFLGTIRYILMQFILSIASAVIAAGLMFLLVAYGIPLVLGGIF